MTGSVQMVDNESYVIESLQRKSREEVALLTPLEGYERVEQIQRWIELGQTADLRITAVANLESLSEGADRLVDEVLSSINKEMTLRFDPAAERSLTRPIAEQVTHASRSLMDAHRQLQDLMRSNLDPNDTRSIVARLSQILTTVEQNMKQNFDPARRDSYLGQFEDRLRQMWHECLRTLTLPDGTLSKLQTELQALRVEVTRRDAAEAATRETRAQTTLKGGDFEDELEKRLADLVRPFGDVIERTTSTASSGTSKKGDFIVRCAGEIGSIAIEAKNGAIRSLPELLRAVREAKERRGVDRAIAIVRDPANLPRQVGTFQICDEVVITSFELLEVALKYVRAELMQARSREVGDIDQQSVLDALADVRAATKRLCKVRSHLSAIDKAVNTIEEECRALEDEIVRAVSRASEAMSAG